MMNDSSFIEIKTAKMTFYRFYCLRYLFFFIVTILAIHEDKFAYRLISQAWPLIMTLQRSVDQQAIR